MTTQQASTSTMLRDLADHAPAGEITVSWLLQRLDRHAFGIVILVLALVGMLPGICMFAAIPLVIPAFEMAIGRAVPTFSRWIANKPNPTRYLKNAVRRSSPALLQIEKAIRPRWHFPPAIIKRLVGAAVIAMAVLLINPIPMIQIIPASIVAVIALAYIQDDGKLLVAGIFAAATAMFASLAALWGLTQGADWISKVF